MAASRLDESLDNLILPIPPSKSQAKKRTGEVCLLEGDVMAITHRYTVMCDQVRREDNGKWLLVGVYEDVVGLPQLPTALPGLTFFMRLESDRIGVWNARIRLEHLETGQRVFEGVAMINFQRPGNGIVPIPTPPFQLQSVGPYNFVMEIQGQELDPIIHSFSVVLGQRPQPRPTQPQG